jgi:hypothetical protein
MKASEIKVNDKIGEYTVGNNIYGDCIFLYKENSPTYVGMHLFYDEIRDIILAKEEFDIDMLEQCTEDDCKKVLFDLYNHIKTNIETFIGEVKYFFDYDMCPYIQFKNSKHTLYVSTDKVKENEFLLNAIMFEQEGVKAILANFDDMEYNANSFEGISELIDEMNILEVYGNNQPFSEDDKVLVKTGNYIHFCVDEDQIDILNSTPITVSKFRCFKNKRQNKIVHSISFVEAPEGVSYFNDMDDCPIEKIVNKPISKNGPKSKPEFNVPIIVYVIHPDGTKGKYHCVYEDDGKEYSDVLFDDNGKFIGRVFYWEYEDEEKNLQE